ncbi:hypothetical protein NDU88_007154 [Pleurodeles waltl]|uniref:Uncharacterized protein n=1 Tax=Pleurodeles waltl TaxID=8319 RepID=A0AAV7UPB1_PLEWA|nr:hypothetical protein NDU88_007154 [Pleurodeles waltl]
MGKLLWGYQPLAGELGQRILDGWTKEGGRRERVQQPLTLSLLKDLSGILGVICFDMREALLFHTFMAWLFLEPSEFLSHWVLGESQVLIGGRSTLEVGGCPDGLGAPKPIRVVQGRRVLTSVASIFDLPPNAKTPVEGEEWRSFGIGIPPW